MNKLKQKALSYLEALAHTGYVTGVKAWEPAIVFEVGLHLPGVNMHHWQEAQYIQVKVGPGAYCNYSPTRWNADTSTCTLLIDAGHEGPGCTWVKNLRTNDTLTYFGIGNSGSRRKRTGSIFCIGDASAIGYFTALEQLTERGTKFSGIIAVREADHLVRFKGYLNTQLEPVLSRNGDSYSAWADRLLHHELTGETVYIAGHKPSIIRLRDLIRQRENFSGTIRLHGFWM